MQKFQTRTELILYARDTLKSRACQRAFDDGKVEVLGGFRPLAPSTSPGWLLHITSKHGRTWYVAITVPVSIGDPYGVWEVDRIPWENWAGDPQPTKDLPYNIHDGDYPILYHHQKEMCKFERFNNDSGSSKSGRVTDRRTTDAADHLQLDQSKLVED